MDPRKLDAFFEDLEESFDPAVEYPIRTPRTTQELRDHLHEMHGAPVTSSIDHRSRTSLEVFHATEHGSLGNKWTAFVPHTH